MKNNRAIVLVLDGLGVGEMEDAGGQPSNFAANTLKHVLEQTGLQLDTLRRLGLEKLIDNGRSCPDPIYTALGKCALAHEGADSFEGHNEIMGNKPKKPMKQTMMAVGEAVSQALRSAGHRVRLIGQTPVLLVDEAVIVADNMETDPGQVINVTGPLDHVPFSQIREISDKVREVVKTNRVIALGGTAITVEQMMSKLVRSGDSYGLDTPALHIYNDDYQVAHLGYGINPELQCPAILGAAGYPVYLYGKMADVIAGAVDDRVADVETGKVMDLILSRLQGMDNGLISATVQETDLAGHAQDAERYAHILATVDRYLKLLIELMRDGDLLLITGDHGNDPTIGHSGHTREYTPFIVYQKGCELPGYIDLGTRSTLADISATVTDFFEIGKPEFGTGVFRDVWEKGGHSYETR